MGLVTYRGPLDQGIAGPYAHLRQYVVSSTLDPPLGQPEEPPSRVALRRIAARPRPLLVLMGLVTYRGPLDQGIASPYAHLRQYVVSSTLDPGVDPAVTVVAGDPLALVRELKREEGTGLHVWLCGGGKLAGALLSEIDELIVKHYPVVAGAGIPAFYGAFDPTVFDVAERTAAPGGVTLTRLTRR